MVDQVDSLRKIWKIMETYTPEELVLLKENTHMLDSFLMSKKDPENMPCRSGVPNICQYSKVYTNPLFISGCRINRQFPGIYWPRKV
jgi:hypothetical protein